MTITAAMSSNMLIREILAARRVYLPNNGYFQSVKQMEDLAHRLESIGHNNQVSAVIIAPHDNTNYKSSGDVEDVNQLPLLATRSLSENYTSFMDPQEQVTFFLGTNWESEDYKQQFLTLQKLVHIVHRMAPAPTVSISHGNVQDGGFALCIGRYNIATEKSSFQVLNPRRGLTLDGGLSFVLPRLGFGLSHLMKNKKDLSTIPMGKVLALTGYSANCFDMVSSGLASHYMDWDKASLLEMEISETLPVFKGDQRDVDIRLEEMMNIYSAGSYHKNDFFAEDVPYFDEVLEDESGEVKHIKIVPPFRMGEDHGSRLIDIAYAFNDIFNESSLVGVVERLKEVQGTEHYDDEVKSCASAFLEGMEKSSPLALHATFRLLNEGQKQVKLMECLEREQKVQMNLFETDDFKKWRSNQGGGLKWKHENINDVTESEVDALFH